MENMNDTVGVFVNYQVTGVGFDRVWAAIGPAVEDIVRGRLRKLGVRGRGGVDEFAVGEVVSLVVEKLMGLAAPGAGGRFDPAKARPGLSGLKGWLFRVVNSQAVNWLRDHRGGRGVKIIPESCLAWNEAPAVDMDGSFLDRQPAKLDRESLRDAVRECVQACVARLPDPGMREIVQVKFGRNLSVRATAEALNVHPSTVQRRLTEACGLLRVMLAEHGIDESALAA